MATISTHPYGLFEEETYAGGRQLFFCPQEPSIYPVSTTQCPSQEYTGYAAYPVIQDNNSWPCEAEDMDVDMSGCWGMEMGIPGKAAPEPVMPQFFGYNGGYPMDFYEPAEYVPSRNSSCADASYQPSFAPLSPVTPAASPLQYCNPQPEPYLVVPSQFQYSPYQQPEQYQFQQPYDESPHPSPYSVPSLTTSPLVQPQWQRKEETGQVEAEQREEEEEDDEEEEEDDKSVIPNCGNKELRGMGLYDDRPDLTWVPCSAPATPQDRLRPTLGKGLVLEQSFGLPEKMMIKDEETGDIIEGKLCVDDDDQDDEEY